MAEREVERMLTYAELGERLGLSAEAARAKAKREQKAGRWRIVHGNDGRARVRLPASAIPDRPPDRPPERSAAHTGNDRPDVPPDVRVDAAGLSAEVAALRAAVAELGDGRARMERLQIEAVEARMDAVRAIAERDATKAATAAEVEARNAVIEELRAELARLRLPFWRRWLGG